MTERQDRANRLDVWEHRSTSRFEVRTDTSELVLTGYASTFEPYEMYGGPLAGGWIEQLDRRSFDEALSEKPDLHLLINHEGMPLARTKSGTLDLSVDRNGLKVTARLDRSDPDVQRLEAKMRRGDMDEMSFAFRVKDQNWSATPEFKDDQYALRTITKVSLHKGDVSVVNFGANPTTHAEMKSISDALDMIRGCDAADLAEVRSGKPGLVDEVVEVLTRTAKASAMTDDETRAAEDLPAAAAEKRGMSLRDALARIGLAAPDGSTLSLADAVALTE